MKLDEKIVRSFAQLRAPEFIPLLEYLKAERQEALEQMAKVSEAEQIYRLQGKVGSLGEFISLVETAEVVLAKFVANRNG